MLNSISSTSLRTSHILNARAFALCCCCCWWMLLFLYSLWFFFIFYLFFDLHKSILCFIFQLCYRKCVYYTPYTLRCSNVFILLLLYCRNASFIRRKWWKQWIFYTYFNLFPLKCHFHTSFIYHTEIGSPRSTMQSTSYIVSLLTENRMYSRKRAKRVLKWCCAHTYSPKIVLCRMVYGHQQQ